MNVTFYIFPKKENSTQRPENGEVVNCFLKESCSVVRPRIEVDYAVDSNMSGYNYCYIPDFDRYYFISDWVCNTGGRWIAECKVDILATCKDRIGGSTLYVLRAYSKSDGRIIDNMYPTKSKPVYNNQAINLYNWMPHYSFMVFVMGVVNGSADESGAVTYYAMDSDSLSAVREFMLSGVAEWNDIKDFSGDVAKAFIDPFQYVVSCTAFPIEVTEIENMTGVDDSVKFGFWDSGIPAKRLTRLYMELDKKGFSVPKHPQSASNGIWLNSNYYTKHLFYSEPWGIINLDSDLLMNTNFIHSTLTLDLVTGECTLLLNCGQGESVYYADGLLANCKAKIGIEQKLSSAQTTVFNAKSLTGGLVDAGKAILGDIANVFSGGNIGDALKATSTTVSTVGSDGGYGSAFLMAVGGATLQSVFYEIVDRDDAENGRPLCKNELISNLTGFIKVANGDIGIVGTQEEQQELKRYLEGGFYYE